MLSYIKRVIAQRFTQALRLNAPAIGKTYAEVQLEAYCARSTMQRYTHPGGAKINQRQARKRAKWVR